MKESTLKSKSMGWRQKCIVYEVMYGIRISGIQRTEENYAREMGSVDGTEYTDVQDHQLGLDLIGLYRAGEGSGCACLCMLCIYGCMHISL